MIVLFSLIRIGVWSSDGLDKRLKPVMIVIFDGVVAWRCVWYVCKWTCTTRMCHLKFNMLLL